MKYEFLGLAFLGAIGTSSGVAYAQEAPWGWRCELGDHQGFDEADAHTAAKLVCAEIQRGGPAPGAVYRVGLGKLGSAVILSLDADVGSAHDQRRMKLSGIEEVSTAAPRIADALLHGKSTEETERPDNLTAEETKSTRRKQGQMQFAVGLFGVSPNMKGMAPGLDLTLHYETTDFSIGAGARFAGYSSDAAKIMYDALNIGGRYYLTPNDVTPFLGGGIAWTWLASDAFVNANGIGAYVEAGVGLLRMHSAHLAIIARVDLPVYSVQRHDNASSSYYAPVSLGAAFEF